jgi:starch phosphorylase
VAVWKARVQGAWAGVALHRIDSVITEINFGDSLRFEVAVNLNGLAPNDVVVEILLGFNTKNEQVASTRHYRFEPAGTAAGENLFAVELQPEQCGNLEYRIRVYPYHELLTHPFELGMMRWL